MFVEPGTTKRLSPGRCIVCDFLHAGQQVPTVAIERKVNISPLIQARQGLPKRPSWCGIFTKAYSSVVAARPELRQVFLTFPYNRIYCAPKSIADVVVETNCHGEDILASVPISLPQERSLEQIDELIRSGKEQPWVSVKKVRRGLKIARLPTPLRRLIWWLSLNVSGKQRMRYWGTHGITTVSGFGADSLRPIAPWTTLLHYGVFDKDGNITLRLTYDHRILDGKEPALALADLNRILNSVMANEFLERQERLVA